MFIRDLPELIEKCKQDAYSCLLDEEPEYLFDGVELKGNSIASTRFKHDVGELDKYKTETVFTVIFSVNTKRFGNKVVKLSQITTEKKATNSPFSIVKQYRASCEIEVGSIDDDLHYQLGGEESFAINFLEGEL